MNQLFYLQRCLKLAAKGSGNTKTNPLVGAVIVKNDRIIAEGYHRAFGGAHAEIEALQKAAKKAKDATLYVNLEPCDHFGKTPPCSDAIIAAGIKNVFICTPDPNPLVCGKGIRKLKKAGIQVKSGFLQEKAKKLNEAYFFSIQRSLPFIALKIAMSLDGKIATNSGDSRWISGKTARIFAHKLRNKYDSCLVGINTVLQDNPHLGVRHLKGRDPLRIIIDPELKIPEKALALRDNNVLILTKKKSISTLKEKKIRRLQSKGLRLIFQNKVVLRKFFKILYRDYNIGSVLVEGGAKTWTKLLKKNLADKIYLTIAPKIIGEGLSFIKNDIKIDRISQAIPLKNLRNRKLGEDVLIEGYF